MPLAKHVVDTEAKFEVNDSRVLRLPKLKKDASDDLVYPEEILRDFIKYFNDLYHARVVFGEGFNVDKEPKGKNPGKSHLDMLVYVSGDLTREDFLDDLDDFSLDHPGVKCELIKRWPNANKWNEKHKAEIEAGEVKPKKEGIMMGKNAASSLPKRTLKTLSAYIDEEEPANPYPNASFEELEALEKNKDKALKDYYKKLSKYEEHQGDLRGLLNAFKEEFGHDFDKNSKEDREDLEYIYSDQYDQKIQENREWYPASVRVHIPVGQFAPGQTGRVNLSELYDSKKEAKKMPINKMKNDSSDNIPTREELKERLANKDFDHSAVVEDFMALNELVNENFKYVGEMLETWSDDQGFSAVLAKNTPSGYKAVVEYVKDDPYFDEDSEAQDVIDNAEINPSDPYIEYDSESLEIVSISAEEIIGYISQGYWNIDDWVDFLLENWDRFGRWFNKSVSDSKRASKKMKKDSTEDEEDLFDLVRLLGEAHDKIQEAKDIAENLINDDVLDYSIGSALDDLEEDASELDFNGSEDPVGALLAKYGN